jgi:spore photoproduct lyase
MANKLDYTSKFESFYNKTVYEKLALDDRIFIKDLSFRHKFTFQEFRQVVEAARDLTMWGEPNLQKWCQNQSSISLSRKHNFMSKLNGYLEELKNSEKVYNPDQIFKLLRKVSHKITSHSADKKIWGMCPVASDKTVCCKLRTIDAVENCVYACSYCTIQTFYTDNIVIEKDVQQKLMQIPIEKDRFYHFGTGQSSDSLAWGNRDGIIEAHCAFARQHPNILMEFKTKSKNIDYFLTNDIPKNIVCSWSLNTPTIIQNEEHFTASLEERLASARRLADKGIKIGFHFHPMVYYKGWSEHYPSLAKEVINSFTPEEVLFVSFGSVTLIKPAIQKIRDVGNPTKILQMNFVSDPHGKLTYPDEIKIKMFKRIYEAFLPWRVKVFIYLCMEKASIWQNTFGYVYRDNDEFEQDFGAKTMCKING